MENFRADFIVCVVMNKPLIGMLPLWDEARHSCWMLPGYQEGLEAAGALPITLPLTADGAELSQLAALCDGFLFTGGQDVEPRLYGEEPIPACGVRCPVRDDMELELLRLAIEKDKPVLGICRGLQLLNVFLGGTLYQDLPTQHPSPICHSMTPPYDRAVHTVTVLPDTPIASLFRQTRIGVNSYHHQAVHVLAPALTEMARSEDGIVEAAYLREKTFVWAVQWHPEMAFREDENSRKLFSAFVSAAKSRRAD